LKKRVIILGSTGSIGQSCLDVIRRNKKRFEVVGITAHSNLASFQRQIDEFKPRIASISNGASYLRMKKNVSGKTRILAGEESLIEMVESLDVDVVVSGIVGSAGLMPTLAAIRKGVRVALANKEPMVMAGKIMTNAAKESGAAIIPVDSEHSAIWQCLNGEPRERIKKVILTASGGPFLKRPTSELGKVTLKEALKHPKWKMGSKITVDSSTLMNKGLEVIEAKWLFNLPTEKIDVMIHPQSIVHSMVEFDDTSVIAQMGMPDMRVPIAYALSYPDRWPATLRGLDLVKEGKLEFFKPDAGKFPCLGLAYAALKKGGTSSATLNAANEAAVELFLGGKIRYIDIPRLLKKVLGKTAPKQDDNLSAVLEAGDAARELLLSYV